MGEKITYKTFEGIRPQFHALARLGYFKMIPTSKSRVKRYLHHTYRGFIWFIILIYHVQQMILLVQVRHSVDKIMDCLFLLLTTYNSVGKQLSFNLRSERIDKIIETINGPVFAPTNSYHVEALKANATLQKRLLTFYHIAVCSCTTLWTVFPIVDRSLGKTVTWTVYLPFETTELPSFCAALTFTYIILTIQAFGHVSLDCTVVSFYALTQMQVKILKYNMEHIADIEDVNGKPVVTTDAVGKFKFKDSGKYKFILQERLKKCAIHFNQIISYVAEVESIFGEAMVIQFIVMTLVICMTMYKIAAMDITSGDGFTMCIYLFCMLAQLFIYYYFGTQLTVESDFINDSIYKSDWLSLSPSFRRQLLLMMEYCYRPLIPRTAYIIPMSLETYILVLRSSYALFTCLKRS